MHCYKGNPQSGYGHRNDSREYCRFLLPQGNLRSRHTFHPKLFQASFQEPLTSKGSSPYMRNTVYFGTYRNLEDSFQRESAPDPLTYSCLVRIAQEAISQ